VALSEILAVVAIAVAVLAGGGLALVYRHLRQYQRNQRIIMGSRGDVDIVQHVAALDEKLTNIRIAIEDLALAARDHDVRIDSSFSRLGIVRFDAYNELGGRQSTAIALLNSMGDGLIMTTVVSRDFARTYVKLIKDGQPDIPLAPEEIEAVNQARGSAPFTIRPRVQAAAKAASTPEESEELPEGAPIALGLPGLRRTTEREVARENRRRSRQGLPQVEGEVVPSARGWDNPTTPAGPTLAERFVRMRRQQVSKPASPQDSRDDGSAKENGDMGES